MSARTSVIALAASALLALTACSSSGSAGGSAGPSDPTEQQTTSEPAAGGSTDSTGTAGDIDTSADPALPSEVAKMLADYGVTATDGVRAAITKLDTAPQTRPLAAGGSIRTGEVIFSDGRTEVTVPIPGEHVYVSIAPFVERTHDCHFHSLGSCQGEMTGEDVHVTITDAGGATLVDADATTYANGFVGFWLPKDTNGTITVTQGERTGQTPFATGDGDATCVTTLQLS